MAPMYAHVPGVEVQQLLRDNIEVSAKTGGVDVDSYTDQEVSDGSDGDDFIKGDDASTKNGP